MVYGKLGEDEPGSEVKTSFGTFSPIAKIGVWLDNNLSVEKNQIVKLTFAQSRYGNNKVGGRLDDTERYVRAYDFPWLTWAKTADHGIAPVIKIKDTLMGTDKWEHFFQQGYWWKPSSKTGPPWPQNPRPKRAHPNGLL